MHGRQVDTYQTVQTTTADPGRVVILLFDGAERFLRQAQHALERSDTATFCYMVSRAQGVVTELSSALDREAGGDLADNLARLYDFMLRHLRQGLIEKKRAHLDEVIALLRQLREGFEGALETVHRETP